MAPQREPAATGDDRVSLLAAYGVALLVVSVLDGLWLAFVARGMYQREIGHLLLADVRVLPAALFYVGYPLGVVLLGLTPRPDTLAAVLVRCAGLGLLAYGTYELTNLATLKGWSVRVAVVDVVWGMWVTALAGAAAWSFVPGAGAARE